MNNTLATNNTNLHSHDDEIDKNLEDEKLSLDQIFPQTFQNIKQYNNKKRSNNAQDDTDDTEATDDSNRSEINGIDISDKTCCNKCIGCFLWIIYPITCIFYYLCCCWVCKDGTKGYEESKMKGQDIIDKIKSKLKRKKYNEEYKSMNAIL